MATRYGDLKANQPKYWFYQFDNQRFKGFVYDTEDFQLNFKSRHYSGLSYPYETFESCRAAAIEFFEHYIDEASQSILAVRDFKV